MNFFQLIQDCFKLAETKKFRCEESNAFLQNLYELKIAATEREYMIFDASKK